MPWSGASAPSSGPCTQPDLAQPALMLLPAPVAPLTYMLCSMRAAQEAPERDLIISVIRKSFCENAHTAACSHQGNSISLSLEACETKHAYWAPSALLPGQPGLPDSSLLQACA